MGYKKYIGIIGGNSITNKLYNECIDIGKMVSGFNIPIICGGKTGVMEAVSRGVKEENGITIGILPGEKDEANEYIDFAIGTGIGVSRNLIIIRNSDIIIAINGSYGTLSEIAFSKQMNKPIIGYKCKWATVTDIKNTDSIESIKEFINKHI